MATRCASGSAMTIACISSADSATAHTKNPRASASNSASSGHRGEWLPSQASRCAMAPSRRGRCGATTALVDWAWNSRIRQRTAGVFSPSSASSGSRSAMAGRIESNGSAVPNARAMRDSAPTALSRTVASSSGANRSCSAERMCCMCGSAASPPCAPSTPRQKHPFCRHVVSSAAEHRSACGRTVGSRCRPAGPTWCSPSARMPMASA
mmetsp:Transcript_13933/g.45651  ORF Transcript_13933/g.45651 Transcript_13933/m.45651 type:complete len:209 (-) Transcript_13933:3476-4102(-)